MVFPNFPNPQALSSATFTPPPLDGSLTIPEIYDFHLAHNGEHPLFVYDGADHEVQTICWRQAVQAIHNASRLVMSELQSSQATSPVVAILAVTDQLSYFALTAGIIRAGCRAFPISPRNSDVGVANLLQKMEVKHIFVSKDQAMQKIAVAACERLSSGENPSRVEVFSVPTFEYLYGGSSDDFEPLPALEKCDINDTVMILHSSGSTSFPKPIVLKHHNLLQWGRQPYYGETDICGRILSNHALPFFHAMGVVSIQWATMAGVTLSNFAPLDPPLVSTPDRVYTSAIATGSNLIFCVPTFLEDWSQDPERLAALQKFDAVLFGGAPIQKAIGDMLDAKGVKLFPFYGATELGGSSKFLPERPPVEGWEYFEISPHCSPVFIDQSEKENIFQLVFQRCPSHSPAVVNMTVSEIDAYNTNDLVIRHPTNPSLWKIYGRSDDQIMHSTGEKTNPVPMETILNRNPMITSAIMFGRGRFQAGVLIEPAPEYAFNPSDLDHLAAFRNDIWPSVEEANQFAPSHSRIFKEIILVADPSKPFQYTPKGTPRRHVVLNSYEEEIENGYAAIEESSQTDIPIPEVFGLVESLEFARDAVEKVVSGTLQDDDDIFQNGCDSLQATWIRNSILHALRQSPKVPTRNIPVNFVYLNPSIGRLGRYMAQLANQDSTSKDTDATAKTITEMEAMVQKYSSDFPQHRPSVRRSSGEVILLTGSTGGLGSYILESLLLDPAILRVYVLNRKDSKGGRSSRDRQQDGFKDRGVDLALLDSPRLVFLEGDTSMANFGIEDTAFEELRVSITCIIHSAWRVDFNVAISSMEPLVAGTRRLIDLALRSPQPSPPRIVFTSSIGVVRNWTGGFAPEAALTDATVAVGSGYPESKWVAERILAHASEKTNLAPVIVRIGQLSGGRNGSWNSHEWVPSIIRSGQVLRCLPHAPGCTSWIPVHIAASALVEMRKSRDLFLHLVHPNPVSWTTLFEPISKAFNAPLVPYSEWLASLEADGQRGSETGVDAAIENPALRLLDFFQSADKPLPSNDAEAFGFPRLSTDAAVKAAPSLQGGNLDPLGTRDVEGWLAYWRSLDFISDYAPLQASSSVYEPVSKQLPTPPVSKQENLEGWLTYWRGHDIFADDAGLEQSIRAPLFFTTHSPYETPSDPTIPSFAVSATNIEQMEIYKQNSDSAKLLEITSFADKSGFSFTDERTPSQAEAGGLPSSPGILSSAVQSLRTFIWCGYITILTCILRK